MSTSIICNYRAKISFILLITIGVSMKRIVSGIQPTSHLTLGNYLGSIKQFVKLQNDYEMFIFVADLHALTTGKIDPINLEKNSKDLIRSYLACGLDANKVNLFIQSSILEHTALGYLITCQTTLGELNRMTQFKDKSQKFTRESNGTQKLPTGLLIYPALMAADILLYSPDYVPVGIDQKQHLELTRNLAERLNNKFSSATFKVPDILVNEQGAKIMDLCNPSVKMSKSAESHKGVIFLNDPVEVSIKKILSAKTDSLNKINYDLQNQPEITNLINIYSCLANISPQEICSKYVDKSYKDFKHDLAEILKKFLEQYQEKFNLYNDELINKIIQQGLNKVKPIAKTQLDKVYAELGLIKYER